MNPELREAIGKALYEASFAFEDDDIPCWDQLSEDTWVRKSTWIKRAEKVVEAFLVPFMPGVTILGQELIKNNPSMRDTINEVFRQATGKDLE